MTWVFYGLLMVLFDALWLTLTKKVVEFTDEYVTAFMYRFASFVASLFFLLIFPIPHLNQTFWVVTILCTLLCVPSQILMVKALKVSPLSHTVPFLSLTPLFLLFVSLLMLHEFPDISGILGVLLIVMGSYSLNLAKRKGILEPILAVRNEKGSVYMVIVAFIYSITATLSKIGIVNSSPVFFVVAFNGLLSLFLLPFILASEKPLAHMRTGIGFFILIGCLNAIMLLFQMMALGMTLVTYVIALKRTSAVLTTIFGYLFFSEKNLKKNLLGVVLMVIGVVMITL